MSIWLILYLVGFAISLGLTTAILEDSKGRMTIIDLWFVLLMAAFSWIGVIALWVGWNAKRNRHPDEK